jgi:hypothetical protein
MCGEKSNIYKYIDSCLIPESMLLLVLLLVEKDRGDIRHGDVSRGGGGGGSTSRLVGKGFCRESTIPT